jgi:hypothetical protein
MKIWDLAKLKPPRFWVDYPYVILNVQDSWWKEEFPVRYPTKRFS